MKDNLNKAIETERANMLRRLKDIDHELRQLRLCIDRRIDVLEDSIEFAEGGYFDEGIERAHNAVCRANGDTKSYADCIAHERTAFEKYLEAYEMLTAVLNDCD